MSTIQKSASESAKMSYGPEAIDIEPDVSKEAIDSKMSSYIQNYINISDNNIKAIELLTVNQSS